MGEREGAGTQRSLWAEAGVGERRGAKVALERREWVNTTDAGAQRLLWRRREWVETQGRRDAKIALAEAGVGERRGAKVALVGRGRLAGGGFLVAGARSVDVW